MKQRWSSPFKGWDYVVEADGSMMLVPAPPPPKPYRAKFSPGRNRYPLGRPGQHCFPKWLFP